MTHQIINENSSISLNLNGLINNPVVGEKYLLKIKTSSLGTEI
jgi:hypothetical protein